MIIKILYLKRHHFLEEKNHSSLGEWKVMMNIMNQQQ